MSASWPSLPGKLELRLKQASARAVGCVSRKVPSTGDTTFTPIRANLPLADHSCGLPADELSWLLNEYKKHLQAIINVDDGANAWLTLSHFCNPTNGQEISN